MNQRNDRRGFLGSLFAVAAGAMASSILVGCAEEEEAMPAGDGPVEHVALRSGMQTRNRVPRRVASVRNYDFALPPVTEHVSSKADRI